MIKVAAVRGAPKYLDLTGTLSRMRTILEDVAETTLLQMRRVGSEYFHWICPSCSMMRLRCG
jgi:hypothetical protein